MTKEESQALELHWREHVERWQQSGQSQAAYCQANGLSYHRFGYWHRKFNGVKKRVTTPGFAQVKRREFLSVNGLSLTLPNGVVLQGVDSDNLAVVCQLLNRLA